MQPFRSLNSCLFTAADKIYSLLRKIGGLKIKITDFLDLLPELFRIFRTGIQPVPTRMRSDSGFGQKTTRTPGRYFVNTFLRLLFNIFKYFKKIK